MLAQQPALPAHLVVSHVQPGSPVWFPSLWCSSHHASNHGPPGSGSLPSASSAAAQFCMQRRRGNKLKETTAAMPGGDARGALGSPQAAHKPPVGSELAHHISCKQHVLRPSTMHRRCQQCCCLLALLQVRLPSRPRWVAAHVALQVRGGDAYRPPAHGARDRLQVPPWGRGRTAQRCVKGSKKKLTRSGAPAHQHASTAACSGKPGGVAHP